MKRHVFQNIGLALALTHLICGTLAYGELPGDWWSDPALASPASDPWTSPPPIPSEMPESDPAIVPTPVDPALLDPLGPASTPTPLMPEPVAIFEPTPMPPHAIAAPLPVPETTPEFALVPTGLPAAPVIPLPVASPESPVAAVPDFPPLTDCAQEADHDNIVSFPSAQHAISALSSARFGTRESASAWLRTFLLCEMDRLTRPREILQRLTSGFYQQPGQALTTESSLRLDALWNRLARTLEARRENTLLQLDGRVKALIQADSWYAYELGVAETLLNNPSLLPLKVCEDVREPFEQILRSYDDLFGEINLYECSDVDLLNRVHVTAWIVNSELPDALQIRVNWVKGADKFNWAEIGRRREEPQIAIRPVDLGSELLRNVEKYVFDREPNALLRVDAPPFEIGIWLFDYTPTQSQRFPDAFRDGDFAVSGWLRRPAGAPMGRRFYAFPDLREEFLAYLRNL